MAEPDTDVIQLKPPEEPQCLTASPATCTITIKGYYRHSSILHMPKSRLAPLPFTSALPFSVITFLPSTHHLPALPFSRPVHHCPYDIIWFLSITLSLSFTLFRCYTVSFPLWCHLCLCTDYTLGVFYVTMMQLVMQTFSANDTVSLRHLTLFYLSLFTCFISFHVFICSGLHELHVSGWVLQLVFVGRKGEKSRAESSQTSAP